MLAMDGRVTRTKLSILHSRFLNTEYTKRHHSEWLYGPWLPGARGRRCALRDAGGATRAGAAGERKTPEAGPTSAFIAIAVLAVFPQEWLAACRADWHLLGQPNPFLAASGVRGWRPRPPSRRQRGCDEFVKNGTRRRLASSLNAWVGTGD